MWRMTVAAMPADWFGRESHPMLVAYCQHVCRSRWLAAKLDAAAEKLLKADGGVPLLDKLLAAAERESRAVMALARSMRLTLQAKYDARAAGRAANGPPGSYYDTMELDDD